MSGTGGNGAFSRFARVGAAAGCLVLANCSGGGLSNKIDPKYGTSASARVVEPGEPVPKGGGVYRVGKPYTIAGREYVPQEDINYSAVGMASWYGDDFHGRYTANGEIFDMNSISAAHPTLPLPCYARVTNLANGRSLIVRVNDRGPYHGNRLIDLSVKASRLLDFHGDGLARVRVEYVGRAPLEGSDDSVLLATLRQGEPAPAPSPLLLASAKTFLPEIGTRIAVLRGAVPVPPDRPYGLGDGYPDPGPASDMPAAGAQRKAEAAAPSARFNPNRMPPIIADGQRAPSPVASFVPARADLAPSIMTGRGLY
jgi:rare lipoprotein A